MLGAAHEKAQNMKKRASRTPRTDSGQTPDRTAILAFLAEHPEKANKRDIARAFGIRGADRTGLRALLRDLEQDGLLTRGGARIRPAGTLPPVAVLRVTGIGGAGEATAAPDAWDGDGTPPAILIVPGGRGDAARDAAPAPGDRILARLTAPAGDGHPWTARVMRRLDAPRADRILGIFRGGPDGGRITPVAKSEGRDWLVAAADTADAADGELVEAAPSGSGRGRLGLPRARILARLGDPGLPRSVSLIAIHDHGIPHVFPPPVLAEAGAARPVDLSSREDLRHLPLLTIDPSDARDHDDAVCALPDPDLAGGHVVWVAIADVAHYVTPGSALDAEALLRGNSTYFPDRVVPMLPEALSADLCSLIAGADRPVIAVEMRLGPDGEKRSHRFTRGLMRSPASLAYDEVQAAADGQPTGRTAPHLGAIAALYAAWRCAARARAARAPLDLDLKERKVTLSAQGEVTSIAFRDRLDAHRLIEDFMILANVAAAETLEQQRRPLVYRVHAEPDRERIETLRTIASSMGLALPKGQVLMTRTLNALLHAAPPEESELISMAVLRSMTQAYYSPQNLGHFGLNLRRYAHFTSPIRRYADLIVHRALIAAHGWGPDARRDGLSPAAAEGLAKVAEAISATERRSMLAERDTTDRYVAAWMSSRIGAEFSGVVSGIARFGAFVKLDQTGADGLIPVSSLGAEYWRYDPDRMTLTGERSRRVIGLGMRATVRLAEAVPVTGGLIFELIEVEGRRLPSGPTRGSGSRARGGKSRRSAPAARSRGRRSGG
jgi:ribonuclease R